MTKRILEIAMSFFFVSLAVSLLLGLFWLKPALDQQRMLLLETREHQAEIMTAARTTRAILAEITYSATVMAMEEQGLIQPVQMNSMLERSITEIDAHSERVGDLARLLYNYRINPFR